MIVTYASTLYAHWLDLLIPSCRLSNPTVPIKAYLMGWTEEEAQIYRDKYPYCNFILFPLPKDILCEEIYNKHTKKELLAALKNRFIPSFSWYKMVLILHEALEHDFIWADADTLILKDVKPLFDKLKDYDVICTQRPNNPEKMQLYAGVMGFASRLNVIKYIIRSFTIGWDVVDERAYMIWSEQLAFYRGLNLSYDIKLYSPEDREHSINCNLDAIILSAKKMGSDKDEQYISMKKLFEQWRVNEYSYAA